MATFRINPRPRIESELVIHRLYEINSEYQAGFDAQLRDLLAMGCERFGLDIGILSRITYDRYEVVQAVAPEGVSLSLGDTFALGDTYCCVTVEAEGPVGFEHVAHSEISTHPAYDAFGLEAYIGAPIHLRGDLYGTLNFSSVAPLQRGFRDVDVECLMFMKSWLEGEIQRRDVERQLAEALENYERLSRIDPLTETLNRRGLSERLQKIAARSAYDGELVGILLIDLDDFKHVNDSFGHSVGDLVIQASARSIGTSLRPLDILGRIGGDEFLALLPAYCPDSDCRQVAERVRNAVAMQSVSVQGQPVRVTCSIGAALISTRNLSVADVLGQVEGLLKQSKTAGKNRFVLAADTDIEKDSVTVVAG